MNKILLLKSLEEIGLSSVFSVESFKKKILDHHLAIMTQYRVKNDFKYLDNELICGLALELDREFQMDGLGLILYSYNIKLKFASEKDEALFRLEN